MTTFKPVARRSAAAILCLAAWLAQAAPKEARRIIAVGGAATEIVYALGAGERLAGVDTTSTYPEAAKRLPQVGYQRSLSAEGILALRPGLLVATADAGPPNALAQIRAAGVELRILPRDYTAEGVAMRIRAVADALDLAGAGRAMEARFRAEWEAARRESVGYATRPRVLFILAQSGNPLVAGRNTAAAAMIALAGAANAVDAFEGYKPLTAEAAIAANPEVLLATTEGIRALGGTDALWNHPALRLTPAGQGRRTVAMDSLYLLGFGPRLPQAVRELARRLHDGERTSSPGANLDRRQAGPEGTDSRDGVRK